MQLMFTDLQLLLIAVSNGTMHTVCAITENLGKKAITGFKKRKKEHVIMAATAHCPYAIFFMRIDSNIDRS